MCCAEFIAKYTLFVVNLLISLAGLAVLGLGIAGLVILSDVQQIIPINILPISFIVLGAIIFLIAFLACCGAIRESQCMLVSYVIAVGILAALKIYITVFIFTALDTVQSTVNGWLEDAFNEINLRRFYELLEFSFQCCGITGSNSYTAASNQIPYTCCNTIFPSEEVIQDLNTCTANNSFQGCTTIVTDWFEGFGGAIGAVLLVIIVIEGTAMILACFFCYSVRQKRNKVY